MNASPTESPFVPAQRVAEIMNPAPRTCSKFSTVTEAVMIFKAEDCGMVPIVDAGQPIGVVTDRDIALHLADHPDLAERPLADIMTDTVISVTPDTTLREAIEVFARTRVRRLLVVDDEGLLIGILAWADVVPHLANSATGQMVTEIVEEP